MRRPPLAPLAAIALAASGLVFTSPASASTGVSTDTVTGVVTTVVREDPRGALGKPRTMQVLRTSAGRIVPLTKDSAVPTGRTITARLSDAAGSTMRVESFTTARTSGASAGAETPVVHQLYVAIVSPSGYTLADNTNTADSVQKYAAAASSYWSDQTGGDVTFQVAQVLPEYVSAYPCGDTFDMWNEALAKFPVDSATGDSVAWGPDRHLVVVAPSGTWKNDICDYGLGTVGASIHDTGNAIFVSDANQSLYAHELGHNLGLNHANALRCTTQDAGLAALPTGCQVSPYDDLLDVMGYSGETYGEGMLNAAHLDDLGIAADAIQGVAAGATATATIAPLAATSTATRGLRVTDAQGQVYYVDYRTDLGRDSVAARNPWKPSLGVEVIREDPDNLTGSVLLDSTPTAGDGDYDRTVPVGGVFRSASGLTTIKVLSEDATGATVAVDNGTAIQEPAALTLTTPRWVKVGATVTMSTTVADAAGTGSPYWGVSLQRRYPGSTTWSSVARSTTDVKGTAATGVQVQQSAYYRFATDAASGAAVRYSPALLVKAQAAVQGRPKTTRARVNSTVRIVGSVSRVPAPVVYVQVKYGSHGWLSVKRASVSGTQVTSAVKLTKRGTAYTRLALRSTSRYVGAVSVTKAVRVG